MFFDLAGAGAAEELGEVVNQFGTEFAGGNHFECSATAEDGDDKGFAGGPGFGLESGDLAEEIGFAGIGGVDFEGGEFEQQRNFGIQLGAGQTDAFGQFELIGEGPAFFGKLAAGGFPELGGGTVGGGCGRVDDEPDDGVSLLESADEFGAGGGFGEAFSGFVEWADPVIDRAVAAVSGTGDDTGKVGLCRCRQTQPELSAGGNVLRQRCSCVGG